MPVERSRRSAWVASPRGASGSRWWRKGEGKEDRTLNVDNTARAYIYERWMEFANVEVKVFDAVVKAEGGR